MNVTDISGQKFNKLTVIKLDVGRKSRKVYWICRCECGTEKSISSYHITHGATTSCGCARSVDLSGKRFGRLIAMWKKAETNNHGSFIWVCKCDCGKPYEVTAAHLTGGNTKSCGCLRSDLIHKLAGSNTKHGKCSSKLYKVWNSMKGRCGNPNDKKWNHYGGRGIKVCDEWENDFSKFYDWAIKHGYIESEGRSKLTIDREDNSKGYSPGNCRWATYSEQNLNRRSKEEMALQGDI